MRITRSGLLRAAGIVAVTAFALVPGATAANASASPVLGHTWGMYQEGYGRSHPRVIFNGGDPTGLVTHIHWRRWGERRAVGRGVSTYVWPGTCVGCNPPQHGAKVVAFHLGHCHGHRSYNAVEWYFPKYDQHFDPDNYINACTGEYHSGDLPKSASCNNVRFSDGMGIATYVFTIDLGCAKARDLIADMHVAPYMTSAGGRFMYSGYRCGTDGFNPQLSDSANFGCELGSHYFGFDVGTD